MSNPNIFTVQERMSHLPDVQKSYMFELYIPAFTDLSADGQGVTDEDLIIRAKTATIPGRDHEMLESVFMGTKQYFVGKATYSSTLEVSFDEFEDQKMTKYFKAWQQRLFNQETGHMEVSTKSQYTKNIVLYLYKGDGTPLEKSIVFVNAWPKTTGDSALDMAGAEKVTRSATFQYDFWKLIDSAGA